MNVRRMLQTCLLIGLSLGYTGGQADTSFGFRKDGSGHFPETRPPLTWSEGSNVVWRTAMPSWSNSSPVLTGDLLFVCSEPNLLLCLNRFTGEILWQRALSRSDLLPPEEAEAIRKQVEAASETIAQLHHVHGKIVRIKRRQRKDHTNSKILAGLLKDAEAELEEVTKKLETIREHIPPPVHSSTGYTTPTPVTNGQAVFVTLGTGVVAAFDLEGKRLWTQTFDLPTDPHGYSSSPLLVDDTLVLEANNKVYGWDAATGNKKWEAASANGFGSPVIFPPGGTQGIVTTGGVLLTPTEGKALTRKLGRLEYNAPLTDTNRVFAVQSQAAGYQLPSPPTREALNELKPAWETELEDDRYYASPLLVQGVLYAVTRRGLLSLLDAGTGRLLHAVQLDRQTNSQFYASPFLAGGLVFITSDDGLTRVVKPGRRYDEVGRNPLEPTRSSGIASGDYLYFRGHKFVYCLGVR